MAVTAQRTTTTTRKRQGQARSPASTRRSTPTSAIAQPARDERHPKIFLPDPLPSEWQGAMVLHRLVHASQVIRCDRDAPAGPVIDSFIPRPLLGQTPSYIPTIEVTDEDRGIALETANWLRHIHRLTGQTIAYEVDGRRRTITLDKTALATIIRSAVWLSAQGVLPPEISPKISPILHISGQLSERTVRHWRFAALRQIADQLNAEQVPVRIAAKI